MAVLVGNVVVVVGGAVVVVVDVVVVVAASGVEVELARVDADEVVGGADSVVGACVVVGGLGSTAGAGELRIASGPPPMRNPTSADPISKAPYTTQFRSMTRAPYPSPSTGGRIKPPVQPQLTELPQRPHVYRGHGVCKRRNQWHMRILIANTLYPPARVGGAERSVELLAGAMVRCGHEVAVACVSDQPDTTADIEQGVNVTRFPLRNHYWPYSQDRDEGPLARVRWHVRDQHNRSATADLSALLESFRPDVINTNNLVGFSTGIWKVASERSVRVVHTLRDYSLLCSRGTLFRDGSHCERRCAPCWGLNLRKQHTSKFVDGVIGVSQFVIDAHRQRGLFAGTPAEAVFNIEKIEPRLLPAGNGPITFGVIGRIEPEKGVDVLLSAASRLAGDWRLRIAGVGEKHYVDGLRRAHSDRRIEWLGHTDADQFYSDTDVLVVPAVWSEPMGRTTIEAGIRGIPVLHSDAGGIPQVARGLGRSREFRAGDADGLLAALEDVVANPVRWRDRSPLSDDATTAFSEEHVVERNLAMFAR